MQKLGIPVAQVFQKCKRMLYFSYPALILRQDTTIKQLKIERYVM
jgi:hypothetical protein